MPYVKKDLREKLEERIESLASGIVGWTNPMEGPEDNAFVGALNYTITALVCKVIKLKFGRLRYWHSPVVRGVLMDVADEFYRRVMAPYEDKQIQNNGDVEEYEALK